MATVKEPKVRRHRLRALDPHDPAVSRTGVRQSYIQNLIDLLHVCLGRGDTARAKRAWAILMQCHEIEWMSRWNWALHILNAEAEAVQAASSYNVNQGRDAEKWLKSLRLTIFTRDKPTVLHALVLNLIKNERYRDALTELETYLPSPPYAKSSILHVYAGMLAFWLAQPESARASSHSATQRSTSGDQVNMSLMRTAKSWLMKALELDPDDPVATEFYRLATSTDRDDDDSADDSDRPDYLTQRGNDSAGDDDMSAGPEVSPERDTSETDSFISDHSDDDASL